MKEYSGRKLKVRFSKGVLAAFFVPVVLLAASESFASPVEWVDWSSVTAGSSGTGTGTLNLNSGTVNVALTGNVYGFSDGTTYYSSYPATFGNLNPSDVIQEAGTGSVLITFDKPVSGLYIALLSVGQNINNNHDAVTYTFTVDGNPINPLNANLVSSGPDDWGPIASYSLTNNSVTGEEFSGVLQFSSAITQLTIGIGPDEYWHGFNLGAANPDNSVPEPATMLLFGAGIFGLAGVVRRRSKQ